MNIIKQNTLKDRKTAAGTRPKLSLASLIGQAILASEGRRARLVHIYEWISNRFPDYYKLNQGGWQNSIRHNLTINKAFIRVPKTDDEPPGKGAYWTIHPDFIEDFEAGTYTKRSVAQVRSKSYSDLPNFMPSSENHLMNHHSGLDAFAKHHANVETLAPVDPNSIFPFEQGTFAEQVNYESLGFGEHSSYLANNYSTTDPNAYYNVPSYPPPTTSYQNQYYPNMYFNYYNDPYHLQHEGTGSYISEGTYMTDPMGNLHLAVPETRNLQNEHVVDRFLPVGQEEEKLVSVRLNEQDRYKSDNLTTDSERYMLPQPMADNNFVLYYSSNTGDQEELEMAKMNEKEKGDDVNEKETEKNGVI